ncbi:hypothetical protein DPMN_175604 [Dreissena polymorpha]|uniref:Uncharacterized protein n=1 Tax=Dreissena polymorpha TaxID=45954 RepID=A0A9D4IIE6_DREPO|nr:hypothetical protein DPMN_175604 [Dreissena polymorpha]
MIALLVQHVWKSLPLFTSSRLSSHYDAGGAPVRDPGSTGKNQGSTRMTRGSTRDDRDEPGTTGNNRGSTGKSLGRTSNDWCGTGNNRDGTENNQDSTIAPLGPIQTLAELQQCPVNASRDATGIHRGSAWALLATTGVKLAPVELRYTGVLPGRCRLSPGLHLGITGDNRGSAGALLGLYCDKP